LNTRKRFKAVFLVPIKALVDQQCEAFRKVFIDQPDSILKPIDTQAGER
jgi:ERCC4-related helicase